MSIKQIHLALDEGHKVYWMSTLYELAYVSCEEGNPYGRASYKDGKAIRVFCVENYFGSLIHEREFENCFLKTP